MKAILARVCSVLAVGFLASRSGLAAAPVAARTHAFRTAAGTVKITQLYHGSVRIEAGHKVIYLDPAKPFKFETAPKADLILITANDDEHVDANAVRTLTQSGTEIISPAEVVKIFPSAWPIDNGENKTWHGWTIEAVPNYREREAWLVTQLHEHGFHEDPHEKGAANGYVMTYGNKRFYFSGASDDIPEIRALKHIDVAVVRMGLIHYFDRPRGVAWDALIFRPKIVIPYEYLDSDLEDFKKQLEGTGVEVRELEGHSE